MTQEVGVRLRTSGEIIPIIISQDQNLTGLLRGDIVILNLFDQEESGEVVYLKPTRSRSQKDRKIIRKAQKEDLEKITEIESEEQRVFDIATRKIKKHGLSMKLVGSSISFDGHNLTFYFTAEGRVDFRELLRDLVRTFKKMIRLQQIGPKDAAKLIGGFGPCGRPVCCATFLSDMKSITMDLARDQNLEGVTSGKISGACGKLMCCLDYETEIYKELKANLPKVGDRVSTNKGKGKVVALNILSQKAIIELEDGNKIEKSYS